MCGYVEILHSYVAFVQYRYNLMCSICVMRVLRVTYAVVSVDSQIQERT